MKKEYYIVFIIISVFTILVGCRDHGSSDVKPDDKISKMVKETVTDDFYYKGHKENNNELHYNFEIKSLDTSAIGKFAEICNESMPAEEIKISYLVSFHIMGGSATMFVMSNYDIRSDDDAISDKLYYLWIRDQIDFNEEACDPTLYSQIEGIKELHVDKAIQEKADDMGIDWYSYWPDLEKVVVEER